jgi:SPP1 family predicted phage head-tail adaptor
MIPASALRHRIRIEESVQTKDQAGGIVDTWKHFKTVHANIKPLRGSELFTAQQSQSEVTHTVQIRYLKDLSVKHRINFKDRIFLIESFINPDERNESLEIQCREVQS